MYTVKDFVLEQSISDATCADIKEAQLIAEMAVITSMIDACDKQHLIAESNITENFGEFEIFSESATTADDDKAETKENKLKTIVNNKINLTKKWANTFWEWLKAVVNRVVALFRRVNIDDLIAMAETLDEKKVLIAEYSNDIVHLEALGSIVSYYDIAANFLTAGTNADDTTLKKINDAIDGMEAALKQRTGSTKTPYDSFKTKKDFIDLLKKCKSDNIIQRAAKLKATLEKNENKEISQEAYIIWKPVINKLNNLYNICIKSVMKVQKKMITDTAILTGTAIKLDYMNDIYGDKNRKKVAKKAMRDINNEFADIVNKNHKKSKSADEEE